MHCYPTSDPLNSVLEGGNVLVGLQLQQGFLQVVVEPGPSVLQGGNLLTVASNLGWED